MSARTGSLLLLLILIVLVGGAPNHLSLTDPDEVFYSQTAREMLQHHSLATPLLFGHPQFEKPPLFYWLLMAVFEVAGTSSLAARVVPALSGLLGVAATFWFCRRVFDREVAWIAGTLLATSSLYLVLSEAVLTDITLAAFMSVASYAFYLWTIDPRDKWLHLFGAAAALAVLTKGPVAIVILVGAGVLFLALSGQRDRIRGWLLHPWVLVFGALCIPWYAYVTSTYGRAFVSEFFVRDNIDRILYPEHHNFDHWWFYPVTLALGLFPWTFDLPAIGRGERRFGKAHLFFLSWFAVTFAVFEIARSKLASYVLPLLPAIVIPLAIGLSGLARNSKRRVVPVVLQMLTGVGLVLLPSAGPESLRVFVTPDTAIGLEVLGVSLVAAGFLMWTGRTSASIATRACAMTLTVFLVGTSLPLTADRAFADAYLRDVVTREGYGAAPVLTDRHYARGVYYYTGNPVVIMDHNPQPFWSPHPLEVLSTPQELERFFAGHDRVLCVLTDADAQELDGLLRGERTNRRIEVDGHKVVEMSERLVLTQRKE